MVATLPQREVSPIPAGRYWIVVIGGPNLRDFDQWIRDMAGAVRVESSALDVDKGQQFVIFQVPPGRAPFLNAAQFGFPNTAPPEVRSIDDVERFPEVQEGFKFPEIGLPVVVILLLLLAGGLGSSSSSRRTRYAA